MDVRLGRLLRWLLWLALLLLALAVTAFALFVLLPTRAIPAYEPVDEYVYLDQGWGVGVEAPLRQTYYYTPQGASLPQGSLDSPVRYDWFLHLELPFSRQRFADPQHMRRYRFLVDAHPTPANPDQLPVGFARHFNAALGEDVLDITCAACHSGEIHVNRDGRRIALRIDGGQAMHAFTDMQRGSFAPTLMASLIATWANPLKFNRFARKVIGARYPQGRSALRGEIWATIRVLATSGQNNPLRHLYPVREGFGRTDALGRIANTVFGDHLVPGNYRAGDAPVSYPYLWNIWKFDWVQYNGSVKQPLARNVGEAMGVGAVLRLTDTYGNPLPPQQRFDSSVLIDNLVTIEHTLQRLQPPRWLEDLLGPIDRARAARGEILFRSHCAGCHGPHPASAARQQAMAPGKSSPDLEWQIEVIPVERIGTDPSAATAFVERRYDLTATGLTAAEVADLLRPLEIRNLARTARWRLTEVVEGRTAAGEDADALRALLDSYPDPDADAMAVLPRSSFSAIATELGLDGAPVASPAHERRCDLACQTAWLAWSVSAGEDAIEARLSNLDLTHVSEGAGLNILGLLIKRKYYADRRIGWQEQQCIEGFGTLDLPQQIAGYKPRPLEGVWATPPFLHNGSVPNLYQMLLPPAQRSERFFVGRRDYDTRLLGYVSEPEADGEGHGFWLDTTVPGNHNSGHAFVADPEDWGRHLADPSAHPLPPGVIGPLLSDEDRFSILEYLKIHRDLPVTPPDYAPPRCGAEPLMLGGAPLTPGMGARTTGEGPGGVRSAIPSPPSLQALPRRERGA